MIGKVQEGNWRPDSRLTVKEMLECHWLPAQATRELRAATISQYRIAVEHWITPNIDGIKLVALTPAHVTEMITKLRTTRSATGRAGLSPRSAQLAVGVLKSAYKWAFENGLIARNPISAVRRPRVQTTPLTTWDSEEVRTFLKATADHRLGIAWALLLTRGLRRGELCGLRWSKVDLEAGVMQIDATRVVVDGLARESSPKTQAGRRSVPLDEVLLSRLRLHKAAQAREKLAAGGSYSDEC